jgi:DNA-binding transcriptional regulator YdaS (Cro superfamily)
MEQPITFLELVDHFGSRTALAKALGVSKSAISEWKGVVPKTRAWQIEVVTDGRFRAAQIIAGRSFDQSNSPAAIRDSA